MDLAQALALLRASLTFLAVVLIVVGAMDWGIWLAWRRAQRQRK